MAFALSPTASSGPTTTTTTTTSFFLFFLFILSNHCSLTGAFSPILPLVVVQASTSSSFPPSHIPTTKISTALSSSTSDDDKSSSSSIITKVMPNSNNNNNLPPQNIGFIGCGTIAVAIATGLATQSTVPIQSISVSHRSESKSKALQTKFPNLVTVHQNNQDILDKADIIFVCVLPEQTSNVLKALCFDKDKHTIVSLVSTSTLEGLAKDTSLPMSSDRIFKCICLPSVSRQEGVCLVTPKSNHEVLLPLFDSLGGVVQAKNEEQMSAMMVPTALMGSMYGILKQSRDWLIQNGGGGDDDGGISKSDASFLVGKLFWGMMQDAERKCSKENEDAFEELIEEQTPGGLNEQGLKNWRLLGGLESLDVVQDKLFDRIRGKSDGSLEEEEEEEEG